MTSRFSALLSSAAFVKLNDPVNTVVPSITMTLLCAMACFASMKVGIPACATKSAEEYFSVRLDLSRITCTLTPRFLAATKDLAIGALVIEIFHNGLGAATVRREIDLNVGGSGGRNPECQHQRVE